MPTRQTTPLHFARAPPCLATPCVGPAKRWPAVLCRRTATPCSAVPLPCQTIQRGALPLPYSTVPPLRLTLPVPVGAPHSRHPTPLHLTNAGLHCTSALLNRAELRNAYASLYNTSPVPNAATPSQDWTSPFHHRTLTCYASPQHCCAPPHPRLAIPNFATAEALHGLALPPLYRTRLYCAAAPQVVAVPRPCPTRPQFALPLLHPTPLSPLPCRTQQCLCLVPRA